MLGKFTQQVIRFRVLVIAIWIGIAVFGLFASANVNSKLSTSLAVPGSESTKAEEITVEHFGENSEGTFTVVYYFKHATQAEIDALKAKVAKAAETIPTGKVIQTKVLEGILYTGIGTSLNLKEAAQVTEQLRDALAEQGLSEAMVTGPPAIQGDFEPILSADLRGGGVLAIAIALAILILVFGLSRAVVIPFVTAGATIAAAISVVYLLADRVLMVLYIPNVVELIGLGLAIDYSILITHRFISEIKVNPSDREGAVVRTMTTAGRTVLLSGLTASIGLTTLFLVPIPFIRSLGAAGLVVPVVSVLAAVTLQPVMLYYLGARGVKPYGIKGAFNAHDEMQGAWANIASLVIKRPWQVLVSGVLVLLVAASSIFWLELTPTSLRAIPSNIESAEGLNFVVDHVGPGLVTPTVIVIDYGKAGQATLPENVKKRTKLGLSVIVDDAVLGGSADSTSQYVDPTGRYQRIFILGIHEFGSEESKAFIKRLRETYIPDSDLAKISTIYVGGAAAQGVDFLKVVYSNFPFIFIAALGIAYFLLIRSFRSLILPLVAVILDLLSLAATYGLLVAVFRFGFLSPILGTYHVSQIEGWVPVFLFAVLFGLSMDYEVFIVSRMREARDKGESTPQAIKEGLAHTGGVVTAAAIILVGALGGLANGHIAGLQELGVGLALGILIDATIVRTLLLPSVMTLLDKWNWWLPEGIAKAAMTKASPLED
ncbi:COG2409 Predicted drug exporters of the RND superfamily [Candidatus Nanopelagicaceae bacterium]